MKFYCVTIQMKATEQYFPAVLFIMMYKVVLTFESVDEILYPGYQRFFSRAAGIFGVGRRPTRLRT